MIKCKGIPDLKQAFSYMYFKTKNEGYTLSGKTSEQAETLFNSTIKNTNK